MGDLVAAVQIDGLAIGDHERFCSDAVLELVVGERDVDVGPIEADARDVRGQVAGVAPGDEQAVGLHHRAIGGGSGDHREAGRLHRCLEAERSTVRTAGRALEGRDVLQGRFARGSRDRAAGMNDREDLPETPDELEDVKLSRAGGGTALRYDRKRKLVLLDPEHPDLSRTLKEAQQRPERIWVLIAAVFGLVNRELENVTDAQEAQLLMALAGHLASNPKLLA